MGIFGWSYPPGCSRTPFDDDDGVTKLQEDVLALLEADGIPAPICDKIVALIAEAEAARMNANLQPGDDA